MHDWILQYLICIPTVSKTIMIDVLKMFTFHAIIAADPRPTPSHARHDKMPLQGFGIINKIWMWSAFHHLRRWYCHGVFHLCWNSYPYNKISGFQARLCFSLQHKYTDLDFKLIDHATNFIGNSWIDACRTDDWLRSENHGIIVQPSLFRCNVSWVVRVFFAYLTPWLQRHD